MKKSSIIQFYRPSGFLQKLSIKQLTFNSILRACLSLMKMHLKICRAEFLAYLSLTCGVSFCEHSQCVNVCLFTFSYKQLLLNQWSDFKKKFTRMFLMWSCFKEFNSMQNFGCCGIRKGEKSQNFQKLLVQKYVFLSDD